MGNYRIGFGIERIIKTEVIEMKRITVQNVQKTIKDTTILHSANLCVDAGEI